MVDESVTLVGRPGDPAVHRAALERDPCLGHYDKQDPTCGKCVAPVIVDGKLILFRDYCQAVTVGASPGRILALTSREVERRLEAGAKVEDIWLEVLNGADPEVAAQAARSLLASRFRYLRDNGTPTPDLPRTQTLVQRYASDQQVD